MLLHALPFGAMIALTVLYFRELGGATLAKYWSVFLLRALALPFFVHAPFVLGLLKWGLVFVLYAKALFSNSSTIL
jgi:hypothetical protein